MSVQQDQPPIAANASPRITGEQWRSGIAAWLGWLFDGLDMHLYVLVSATFVAELLNTKDTASADVKHTSSFIQAAFLVGWAAGGSIFGRLGDRFGRARALSLTILTYALFTGLSAIAQTWWQLLVFRFISALGIGGEWAVGSSLLFETWPANKRAWLAAILQTGVNLGILIACAAWALIAPLGPFAPRYLFLVGVLPAFLVFWIRKKVPEPAEWTAARVHAGAIVPSVADLFRGSIRRTTLCAIGVCALSLTAWWAFLFWDLSYLRSLPELANPFDRLLDSVQWDAWRVGVERLAALAFFLVVGVSIAGNFFAAWIARRVGYRRAIILTFAGFFVAFLICYGYPWSCRWLMAWMAVVGFFSGVFGLFTMYLPPLFPTLLRTTGAGLCFNIGRIAAAAGTVIFGFAATAIDFRTALFVNGFLFLPAIFLTFLLPDLRDR